MTGRKKEHQKIAIPQSAEGVLVFTDYLKHLTAMEVKTEAKRKGIKAVFVKRYGPRFRSDFSKRKVALIMLQQVSGVVTPETKNRPLCG